MKKPKQEDETWETPSLEWIHRVRRERQGEREGRPMLPLSRREAEKLARQYGLKLAKPVAANR